MDEEKTAWMGQMMLTRGWGKVVYSNEKEVMASKVLSIPLSTFFDSFLPIFLLAFRECMNKKKK